MNPEAEPATKADVQRLDHKIDGLNLKIEDVRLDLGKHIYRLEMRQDRMEQNMATKSDIDRLYGAVMKSLDQGRMYSQKAITHGDQLQDHEARLKNHERRLGDLESKQ